AGNGEGHTRHDGQVGELEVRRCDQRIDPALVGGHRAGAGGAITVDAQLAVGPGGSGGSGRARCPGVTRSAGVSEGPEVGQVELDLLLLAGGADGDVALPAATEDVRACIEGRARTGGEHYGVGE